MEKMQANDMGLSVTKGVGEIRIEEFDYPLPEERIALHPLTQRDACRLLVNSPQGEIIDTTFSRLPEFLTPGTLMICNETRVINARMEFFRSTGGRIEVFLLEPADPSDYVLSFASRESCEWSCMIGNLKKWKHGEVLSRTLDINGKSVELHARLLPLRDGEAPSATRRVRFEWDDPEVTFATIVELAGNIPIPPYLKRDSEKSDLTDYQTIYSRVDGSVAAPTAGLHFTPELFGRLRKEGVDIRKVILHVGAGTFQPVKSEHIGEHPMHTESIRVDVSVIRALAEALKQQRPILAVGTTSVRTIESLPWLARLSDTHDPADVEAMHVTQWMPYDLSMVKESAGELLHRLADRLEESGLDALTASTAIMIAPGYDWQIVTGMITNFHQPQSTLLLLVCSFLEKYNTPDQQRWQTLYRHALDNAYRFLSYGDACLFFRDPEGSRD